MSQEKLIEVKNLKTFFNTEAGTARAVNDAVLALIALGYKQADAAKAIKKAATDHEGEPDADEFIRSALRGLK